MRHIKQLRINAGFKTSKLASDALGISQSMMKKIECGIKKPSISLGFVMLDIFGCTLEDIFLPYKSQNVNKGA